MDVGEAGRIMFGRADGKYVLYRPKNLVEDCTFRFFVESSVPVNVVIDVQGKNLTSNLTRRTQEKDR